MADTVYVSRPCCWAPGVVTPEDWDAWAAGTVAIERTTAAPKLEFTDALFRRRLGQLCKMTVQVVHDALKTTGCGDIPLVFVSTRGEVTREFTVNRTLIEDSMVLPAAFSLSVFNAPIALATISCHLTSGYSVIFPSKGNVAEAFAAAAAPLVCGEAERLLFVYGDELVPEAYGALRPADNTPLAFAAVVSRTRPSFPATAVRPFAGTVPRSPAAFLAALLSQGAL